MLLLLYMASICFINYVICTESLSETRKTFSSSTLLKKLELQSRQTYSSFKNDLNTFLLKDEMKKDPEGKEGILGYFMDSLKKMQRRSPSMEEDPQIQFGKLAFLYITMNRGDLGAVKSIKALCGVEELMNHDDNYNLCGNYSEYLVNLIEMRIGVITSRLLYSDGILGIPLGWYDHVQEIGKELREIGILPDSLKQLMILLTTVAKPNEEIDVSLLPKVLSPKTFFAANTSSADNPNRPVQAPVPPQTTHITVDATNLTRQITRSLRKERDHSTGLDPTLSRMLPGMLVL